MILGAVSIHFGNRAHTDWSLGGAWGCILSGATWGMFWQPKMRYLKDSRVPRASMRPSVVHMTCSDTGSPFGKSGAQDLGNVWEGFWVNMWYRQIRGTKKKYIYVSAASSQHFLTKTAVGNMRSYHGFGQHLVLSSCLSVTSEMWGTDCQFQFVFQWSVA